MRYSASTTTSASASPLDVAALVGPRLALERAALDRLVRVEQRLEHLPLDVDQRERGARLGERVGRDGRDRGAVVRRLVSSAISRSSGPIARGRPAPRGRGLEVEPRDARLRVRAAQHGRVEHARAAGRRT